MIIELDHPKAGVIKQPNFPIKFSKTPVTSKPAPMLGQHNDEILHDILGYNIKEIAQLRQEGVIT